MSTDPTSFVPDILDFEDIDNSSDNNFFDHIDDLLLDFPQQNAFVGGRGDSFPSVWNANPFSCFNPECSPELAAELSVPNEDAVQMEWLSAFVEDSYPNENLFRTIQVPRTGAIAPSQSHSRSPISVLESSSGGGSSTSSSSSVSKSVKILPLNAGRTARTGYGRARTKRARPPTLNMGSTMQLISPAQSSPDTHYQKKKRSRALEKDDNETNPDPLRSGVRKCLHCEITQTPQWRTGPLGPKTLCNACGVRYKSGRLYPEYRPAASPTFVPSLHSNSHKKVLEMRISSSDKVSPPSTPIDSTA